MNHSKRERNQISAAHAFHRMRWSKMDAVARAQVIDDRMAEAGVAKKFRSVSFETFNPVTMPGLDQEAFDACQEFANQGCYRDKNGLLLLGTPGNGKSSLAACALRGWLTRSRGARPCRFWNVPRGLIAIQQEFGQDNRKATPIIDLANYPFLVLDDLGKHKWSEWAQHQMYSLLDEMWSEERPLIITTNEPIKEFMALDKAMISRIRGSCHILLVQGEDHRLAVQQGELV